MTMSTSNALPDGLGGRLGLSSGDGELRSLTGDVMDTRPPNLLIKSPTLAFLSILRPDKGLTFAAGLGGTLKPFDPDGGAGFLS